MTHKHQTLAPLSKYTQRNCPITRRQLQPGDQVVICQASDTAILMAAFNEGVQNNVPCPGCKISISQPIMAQPAAASPRIHISSPEEFAPPWILNPQTTETVRIPPVKRQSYLPRLMGIAMIILLLAMAAGIQPWRRSSMPQATPTTDTQSVAAQVVTQPSNEPVATMMTTSGIVLLSDDFSDTSSGWDPEYRSGNNRNGYRDGGYGFTIVNGSPHMRMWDILPNRTVGNAIINVDVTRESGEGWIGMVLAFDGSPETLLKSQEYLILVSHKGALVIEERSGSSSKRLDVDKSHATPTLISSNIPHRLTIIRQQGTLIVMLDGNELGRSEGSDLGSGLIGLVIESPDRGEPLSVLFDNLHVSEP